MVYKPFVASAAGEKGPNLCFNREMNHVSSNVPLEVAEEQPDGTQNRTRRLRVLPDISGYSTVFLPGHSANFIFKTSTSLPHVLRLRGESVRGLSSFDSAAAGCSKGFVYLDSKVFCLLWFRMARTDCLGYCSDMPVASRNTIRLSLADENGSHRGGSGALGIFRRIWDVCPWNESESRL